MSTSNIDEYKQVIAVFDPDDIDKNEMNFILACANDNVMLANWILQNSKKLNIHTHTEAPFRLAIRFNSDKAVTWLWHISKFSKKPIDHTVFDNEAFRKACKNGYYDKAVWLYKLGGVDVSCKDNYPLRAASKYGHKKIVEWLLSLGADVNAKDGYALRMACLNGHYDVVCVLLEVTNIIINTENNEAFINACKNGHLEIVKKLRDHRDAYLIKISYHQHEAYRMTYINNHIHVAKWFRDEVDNRYKFTVTNNVITSFDWP